MNGAAPRRAPNSVVCFRVWRPTDRPTDRYCAFVKRIRWGNTKGSFSNKHNNKTIYRNISLLVQQYHSVVRTIYYVIDWWFIIFSSVSLRRYNCTNTNICRARRLEYIKCIYCQRSENKRVPVSICLDTERGKKHIWCVRVVFIYFKNYIPHPPHPPPPLPVVIKRRQETLLVAFRFSSGKITCGISFYS